MNVFCCHSSSDKDIVKPIAASLKVEGHSVFLDEWSLVPGDSLVEKIPDAIARSGVFIFFLSKASKASAWCSRELAIAVSQMIKSSRIRVFAYRMERVDPPLVIDDMLYIDACELGYDPALTNLKLAVNGKSAPSIATPYDDIVFENYQHPIETTEATPEPYHAALAIRAKRFKHPRVYLRITASAPISTKIIQAVPGFVGTRTSIASAVHGHVLEHTQGPPGLEPEFPWLIALFSKQPVTIQRIEFQESNPFNQVSDRAAQTRTL